MSISQSVTDFVTLAIQAGGWMALDRLYLQNRVLAIIGENSMAPVDPVEVVKTPLELVDELVYQARKNAVIGESSVEFEQLEAQLMDFLTPPPSVVNAFFAKYYEKDPKEATTYFYEVNKRNNFIKTKALAKNRLFSVQTEYGELEAMIYAANSDQKSEQTVSMQQRNYPNCLLCMENEGYKGDGIYPARTNHRMIRMNLDGESWSFQFDPSAYFNEQSIISAEEHRPMSVSTATLTRLIRIIEVFPHYFAGFNGSEAHLIHDHYQAGYQQLPLEKADIEEYIELAEYPLLNAGIVKWPLSVIRLESPNSEDLIEAGSMILEKWQQYSDDTDSTETNSSAANSSQTIAAVARRKGKLFEMDIILQTNKLTEATTEVQLFDTSSLCLIEMMGLAVVPAQKLKEIKAYLLGNEHHLTSDLKLWAEQMKKIESFNEQNVQEMIEKEVGQKFLQALADASVFKRTIEGQAAFKRFIASI